MWALYLLDIAVVAKRHVHLEAEQVVHGACHAEQALMLQIRAVILLKVAPSEPEDDRCLVIIPTWKSLELVQVLADDIRGLPVG